MAAGATVLLMASKELDGRLTAACITTDAVNLVDINEGRVLSRF
jgi:hypothetical protein